MLSAFAFGEVPESDRALPVDPADITGQLDNGLSYIIRKNTNPPGKVAMNLVVRSGSLNETDQQRGLAHFLEHMAFDGSAHFAPGKLLPLLEHLGMQFGADLNAYTNQSETVYKLLLPDTTPATLDLAMKVFSDDANGLVLGPLQIESERRIILDEALVRQSVTRRMWTALNHHLAPGEPVDLHDTMGDAQTINTIGRDQFVDYWNTWYRPEKMCLVVVGDIDPQDVITRAKTTLGSFKARAPAREASKAGLQPTTAPSVIVVTDPEQPNGTVELLRIISPRPVVQTEAEYRATLVEDFATRILNLRLESLVREHVTNLLFARVWVGEIVRGNYAVHAQGAGQSALWRNTLDTMITELHRVSEHGVSQQELDKVRATERSTARWAVDTEPSRDSVAWMKELTNSAFTRVMPLAGEPWIDVLNRLLPGITVDEVRNAFDADFKTKNFVYFVRLRQSGLSGPPPTEGDVLAAADASWAKGTTPHIDETATSTLLDTEPTPGNVKSKSTDPVLGLSTVVFDNGVVMHHKFSDYRKDQILVQITLPGGLLEESAANHGISYAAASLWDRPATNRLSSGAIRDLLAGKNVTVSGKIGVDAMSVSVRGSPADLSDGLRLIYALLTDGKLEDEAIALWRRSYLGVYNTRPSSADLQTFRITQQTIYGNDARLLPLSLAQIDGQNRDRAEAWFKRIAGRSAIELSIVGDVQLDEAVALIARYIGSLPNRTGTFADLDSLRRLPPSNGPYIREGMYRSVEQRAVVTAGFVGVDENDPDRRPLAMAAQILTDRMLQQLRFHEQLVYSIRCNNSSAVEIPGTGTLTAKAVTDTANADKLGKEILEIIQSFAATGPTDEELATVRSQFANQYSSRLKDPAFWAAETADMIYHHRSIDDLKRIPEVYQTFTAEQIRSAVSRITKNDRLIRFEVSPLPSSTSGPTTATSQTTTMP